MNKWLRLSIFSLVGIILSMLILSFISPKGYYGYGQMNSGIGMNNMQNMQPMQDMASDGGMNMMGGSQSGMGMMPMSNMQQSGMSSMPMSNMNNMSNMSAMQGNSNMQIAQMLNQLQMEINQLKQQMSSMRMGSMSSGGGMGMM